VVVSTVAVIDLDVSAVSPVRAQPRPRWRYWLVALLLMTTGAAAPVARDGGLVRVADTEGQAAYASVLTASVLYTAEGSAVLARPLTAGAPRWTMPVITGPDGVTLARSGSVVIADAGPESVCTFLDAATGALLWQSREGDRVDVLGDRVAVWSPGGEESEFRLRVAALRTGQTIWVRPAEVGAMTHDADGRVLVTFDFNGRVTSYDAADGRVLARDRTLSGGEVPELDADLHEQTEVSLGAAVAGEQLYLYGDSSVAAYRVTDLSRLWRTRTAASRITACGAAVCAAVPQGISILDPASGAVRRTGRGWRSISGGGVAVADGGQATLVDLATGRDLRPLGHGEPAGDLLLFWDTHGMWVTELRRGRPIGLLRGVDPIRCAAVGDRLACPLAGQAMAVWTIDRS
jgi:outer membrane protein assembly factor BamB